MADTYLNIKGKLLKLIDNGDGTFSMAASTTTNPLTIGYKNASGNATGVTPTNALPVQLSGSNVELKAKTTITWDGVDKTNNVEVPVSSGDALICIDNNCDKDLVVTLEHKIEDGVWASYFMGDGTEISFTIPATVSGVFGVFQKFPKFLGGRIVFTATEEPTTGGTTVVQVQEV